MKFDAPTVPRPNEDEAAVLLGFLRWKRQQVVATAQGLSEEQLRWRPDGRLLPILGIINHLSLMEWRWIEGRYLGRPFPPREPNEFAVARDRRGPEIIDAYARQAARTEAVVGSAPTLDVHCVGEEDDRGAIHEIFGFEQPVSLRWVLLHVIDDTAHHAGHADSTREMLDGTRMSG